MKPGETNVLPNLSERKKVGERHEEVMLIHLKTPNVHL